MRSHNSTRGVTFNNEIWTTQVNSQRRLEVEAWLDLAGLYTDLESWRDADICINRAKAIQYFCPWNWHATGLT